MAHSLSARKRIRQNVKHRARNRRRKELIKDSVKDFLTAVSGGDYKKAQQAYREATRTLDKVAATGTIHRRTAGRRKSRLAARLNALKKKA